MKHKLSATVIETSPIGYTTNKSK